MPNPSTSCAPEVAEWRDSPNTSDGYPLGQRDPYVESCSAEGVMTMTTWFTADQHFGHARLLELSAARGAAFSTVAEMNARLVHSWNSVVQPDDTVWVLGDSDMHG